MVPDGGMTYHTSYTPPKTGNFSADVWAANLLNSTEFAVTVYVVPMIRKEEWSVGTFKPWVSGSGDYCCGVV